jgi:hypothetical protein
MFMPKQPLSVTLDQDNLLWLRGLTTRGKRKSLSDALDAIVTEARRAGGENGPPRSVVGTVDIPADDADLAGADAHVGTLFAASLARPIVAREPRSTFGGAGKKKARG